MSPENQAENTTPSTEKTAKATPPKPSKPKSSVNSNPSRGERIHPKKAEDACQTAYRRRIGDPVCILRNSMV